MKFKISKNPCLTNCCNGKTFAHECICNPPSYICKHSHGQPRQDAKEPRFCEVKLQNLREPIIEEEKHLSSLIRLVITINALLCVTTHNYHFIST